MSPSPPPALQSQLLAADEGMLPWIDVMRWALYDPAQGYYAGKPPRVGRSGDFYTAVSVGPLYGQLLAEQAARLWDQEGRPEHWMLVEQAAHDGQLTEDVLQALRRDHPDLAARIESWIVEPQVSYREVQRQRLGDGTRWVASAADLPSGPGLLICNELLDALPVHRVVRTDSSWREQTVTITATEGLAWSNRPITHPAVLEEVDRLPSDLPDGYATEIHLAALDWLRDLARSPFAGSIWIADYGFHAEDYYSPDRTEGTLRRYLNHQMDGQVLEALGQADLTSHINLTRLMEVGEEVGFDTVEDSDQGSLLTRLATPWLKRLDGVAPSGETAGLLRQFQTLTHPAHMGRTFRILLLKPSS